MSSGDSLEETLVVGVRLHPTGRTIELAAGGLTLTKGEAVIMEDRHGVELAMVTAPSTRRVPRGPLGRVLRRADARDLARRDAGKARAAEALTLVRTEARARRLPMKVFHVEIPARGPYATVYFSAEERIDFRDLLRDLQDRLHLRLEMRQVGVRDEAKMVGGIGSCGQELCCTTFLPAFAPVSIKMAKNQSLALNPARVTGQCGRLKCCLIYEDATYVEAGKNLPKIGKRVTTPEGTGRVADVDVLAGKVRVYFDDGPPRVFAAQELQPATPSPKP